MEKRLDGSEGDAVVVLANGYRFVAGQVLVQACIESRAVLWCRSGLGQVEVDGEVFEMSPWDDLVLPWGRRMVYRADRHRPFHLAAVHWVPCHGRGRAVQWGVAHGPESELAGVAWRGDRVLTLAGVRDVRANGVTHRGRLMEGDGFHQLLELIVTLGSHGCRDGAVLSRLGWLLEHQLAQPVAAEHVVRSPVMQLLMDFMVRHMDEPVDLQRLTREAGCSRATVLRLFRGELRTTPQRWLTELRMGRACQLLRGTALPVHEVARRVGFADAAYFSNVFSRSMGMSPGAFRRASMPV